MSPLFQGVISGVAQDKEKHLKAASKYSTPGLIFSTFHPTPQYPRKFSLPNFPILNEPSRLQVLFPIFIG
jgi:hypothetical protein